MFPVPRTVQTIIYLTTDGGAFSAREVRVYGFLNEAPPNVPKFITPLFRHRWAALPDLGLRLSGAAAPRRRLRDAGAAPRRGGGGGGGGEGRGFDVAPVLHSFASHALSHPELYDYRNDY